MQAFRLTPAGLINQNSQTNNLDEFTQQCPAGLYTTFRTYAGGTKVFGLSQHLNRLYQPALVLGITPSLSVDELRRYLSQACSQQNGESRVRLILATTDSPGTFYFALEPFSPLPAHVIENGVKVISTPVQRKTPKLKSTTFIHESQPIRKKLKPDVYELLLCQDHFVLEGMTSNFYIVHQNKIITAQKGILLGVTRRIILKLARKLGLIVEYRMPSLKEPFDEAFITSSSRGIVPVVEIDGIPVGKGIPGEMVKQLRAAYEAYIFEKAEVIN